VDIFTTINNEVRELEKYQPDITTHPGLMKGHISFLGELLLGHLRYGTQGKNNAEFLSSVYQTSHNSPRETSHSLEIF
jgi:amidophosphoribosyltransferase